MPNTLYTLGNHLTLESALTLDSDIVYALQQATLLISGKLQQFADDSAFDDKIQVAFGTAVNTDELQSQWQAGDLSGFPLIEIVSGNDLNGANGAYAIANNRIYLSYEFLSQNQGNLGAIVALLLEEYGHYVDGVLNSTDALGDEGAIFASLVLGESLSEEALAYMKAEDDAGVISIGGVSIAVEMANLTGDGNNNNISGTNEDDVIDGLGGNDTLSGLEGNDTINSGLGYDTVNGGEGNDLLMIDYSSYTSFYPADRWGTPGLYTNIQESGSSHSGSFLMLESPWSSAQVHFSNIERFNIIGSRTNDSIRTGNNDDTINGHEGNDLIYGGGGNDVIEGGAGNDNINGEDGNDTINGGEGNDIINGGNGNDIIDGGNGNDIIDGGNGNDIINGGLGDDYITQGLGVNQIDGGAGLDTLLDADFSSLTGDRIYKDDGATYPLITLADSTQIQNIEYFINFKTGNGNDTINFTLDVGNIIDTGAGNDVINSGLGYDTVNGGEGNDLLIIDYSSYTSFYPADRWGTPGLYTSIQESGGSHSGSFLMLESPWSTDQVQFSNIERFNVTGSRTNDSIRTGNNNDTVNGAGGIDTINAGGGADKIILADAIKQYYDDLNTTTNGRNDYANIIGFETQDIIQLAGSPSLYRLSVVGSNTELYLDKPGSEPDELIGIIQGVTNLSLASDNFIYVQPVNLSVSTTTGTEAGTTVITVTATTLSPVLRDESVSLNISGSTTSADYTLSNNTIIIPSGSNTGTVTFTVVNDNLIEPTETATLTISNPSSGLVLGSTTSRNITIINDDFPFVNLSVSSNAGSEAGTTVITVTATASSPVLSAQTVNLAVTGTGITTGDYTLSGSIINIPNGGTTGTRTFTIVNDTLVEGTETATIAISSISSGLLLGSTTSQTVTITDNDFPRVNLSVSSNAGSEAGTTIVTVTANASDPVIGNQTVDLAITGTGITSEDYNLSNSTITILDGQTTGTVTFTIVDDALVEGTETATLTLTNPSSGLILGSTISQAITLTDNDFAPPEDGNFDGIPDDQQDNVLSLQAPNNQYVTFAAPLGQPSVNVQTTPNPDPANTPPNVDFSLGFFAFNLPQVTPGDATTITLFLPQGSTVNSYWKYGPTPDNPNPHWYDFTFDSLTNTGAIFQDINSDGQNEIILHFVDGQRGDEDLTANGEIIDPGAPAFTENLPNTPPTVLNPITDVNVNEDSANTVIDLTNVFSDVDGDVIVKSVFVNNNPGLVTATIVDNQLTLDYQDNQSGIANLTIRGTSNGKTVDNSFTITVASVNDAPTLQQEIANQTATENQPFSFTIPANTFTDIDGDNLTYTLAIATVLPSGITFDAATGTFSGTPSDTASGTYNLTVIASDSAGEKANDSFSLNVLNVLNGSSSSETVNGTSGDDHINAGAGNDTVNGGEGNDIIDGGIGNDRLAGGPGDDTYIVDSSRDVAIENAGQGQDTIKSSVNYTLTVNIENITLTGNANIDGTGNNLDNVITGNSGNNLLKGLDGNDTLIGSAGNDTLIGGKGNDVLTGGDGSDSFLFGSGAIFNSSDFGVDNISDFIKGSDKIILSKTSFNALVSTVGNSLQAAEFASINDAANELNLVGSSSAKIVYNLATGNLFYNQNGASNGLGNGALFVTLNSIPQLNENDIFLQA
jgi:Ca2+-binding RTX toxin-like protein